MSKSNSFFGKSPFILTFNNPAVSSKDQDMVQLHIFSKPESEKTYSTRVPAHVSLVMDW